MATTALWLDAADSSTITESSGAVSEWRDKSGRANHATASGTAQPTTATRTINSLNVLDFNGTSNFLGFAAAPLLTVTAASAFFVAQLDNDPPLNRKQAGAPLGDWGSSAEENHFPFTNGVIFEDFMSSTRYSAGNPSLSMATSPFLASMNSAPGSWQLFIDGSSQFSATTNTVGAGTSPKIGRSTDLLNQDYMDGRIAEIVVFDQALPTFDRQKVEGYLAHKWGLLGSLPTNHPYKVNVPTP
jgi:hypothetical protein